MTDTDVSAPVRERLAMALYDADGLPENALPWELRRDEFKQSYFERVDAILAEIQEPSEGTVHAVYRKTMGAEWKYFSDMWRAGIQHIRDGGS